MKRDIIVIGASAGGVEALSRLFKNLEPRIPAAIAVVLHRHPQGNFHLATVLGRHSAVELIEASDGMEFQCGRIHLAPRDQHLLLETQQRLRIDHGPKQHFLRPAIDPLFISAASHYGQRVIGLVLTGGGSDGTRGLIAISQQEGVTLAQDPEEATTPFMPRNAFLHDHVERLVRLQEIPSIFTRLIEGGTW
jgi:two-component system, chemotaxis family, protein-glutamate methylesterase/glutaminase